MTREAWGELPQPPVLVRLKIADLEHAILRGWDDEPWIFGAVAVFTPAGDEWAPTAHPGDYLHVQIRLPVREDIVRGEAVVIFRDGEYAGAHWGYTTSELSEVVGMIRIISRLEQFGTADSDAVPRGTIDAASSQVSRAMG